MLLVIVYQIMNILAYPYQWQETIRIRIFFSHTWLQTKLKFYEWAQTSILI